MWQILRAISSKEIVLEACPELARLLNEGETLEEFSKLPVEKLLLRWFNFHLKAAGQPEIKNFGKDLQDSKPYFYLLNQLNKDACPLDGIDNEDLLERAKTVLENAANLNVPDVTSTESIMKANIKANTLFIAHIYNTENGLGEEEDLDEEVRQTVT